MESMRLPLPDMDQTRLHGAGGVGGVGGVDGVAGVARVGEMINITYLVLAGRWETTS